MKKVRFFLYLLSLSISVSLSSTPLLFYGDVWTTSENDFGYFGLRSKLAKQGIYFDSLFTFDLNWPARGGIKTSSYPLNQYLYSFSLGVETDHLTPIKGGRFLLNFQYHQTEYPSGKYVGDWQYFDNLTAPGFIQLAQLWYLQMFFDQKLAIWFGKIDAYMIFNYVRYADVLLNNSFSANPTIIAFPSYPYESVGVIAEYYPVRWISLRASLFDGSSALGIITGNKGARRFFNHLGDHAFLLNEVQFQWGTLKNEYPGNVGLGVWSLTATLQNFQNQRVRGTAGVFAFAAQTIVKENRLSKKRRHEELRELGFFAQAGVCSKEIYEIKEYFGTGLTLYNLIHHFQDTLSIGMATVVFSNARGAHYPKHFETSLEATYQFQMLNYFTIQPDFQYIIHPGGQGLRNVLVATLRLMASM